MDAYRYINNRRAADGSRCYCPVCGSLFKKKAWNHIFDSPKCAQKYHSYMGESFESGYAGTDINKIKLQEHHMRNDKRSLYESIMRKVSVEVKKAINEAFSEETASKVVAESKAERLERMLSSKSGRKVVINEQRKIRAAKSINESSRIAPNKRQSTLVDAYNKGIAESRRGYRKLVNESKAIARPAARKAVAPRKAVNESVKGFRHVSTPKAIGMRRR